jgi:hypothetical protein
MKAFKGEKSGNGDHPRRRSSNQRDAKSTTNNGEDSIRRLHKNCTKYNISHTHVPNYISWIMLFLQKFGHEDINCRAYARNISNYGGYPKNNYLINPHEDYNRNDNIFGSFNIEV